LVSLFKPHQHTAQSEILVWDQPLAALSSPGWRGLGNYKVLAALLFATMVVLYVVFA
jgi:SSS family solute:Na+ symporter